MISQAMFHSSGQMTKPNPLNNSSCSLPPLLLFPYPLTTGLFILKQIRWIMPLVLFYPKNRTPNGNLLHSFRNCSCPLNAIMKFMIRNFTNLQYFKKPQNLNQWQAYWLTELQEFHFILHHIPGKANSKADILSCHPGFDQGQDNNYDVTLLPPTLFVQAVQFTPLLPLTSPYLQKTIRAHWINKFNNRISLDNRIGKKFKKGFTYSKGAFTFPWTNNYKRRSSGITMIHRSQDIWEGIRQQN